jgi:signal transduction histidine kinase
VADRLQASAAAKRIDLVFQEQQSTSVRADELALDQITENLLSNAIKFTPIGGKVEVAVRRKDDGAEISVADTGPGVSDAEQPLLFKKFSRLSPRPTGGESSHGLGLMLVHRLVVAMGGSVLYERRQPAGSAFIVRLRS